MDALTWLQDWYLSQCDGDWEHSHGIDIGTLDNPGWRVEIRVAETELEGRPFVVVRANRAEHDWIDCRVEDGVFKGFGGPLKLTEILDVFRRWAEGD
jgi:hypothetical protein